jgi:hypothetical protein
MVECGECDKGKIGKGKQQATCPLCNGTGEAAEAFDVTGKLITPGALARFLPRPVTGSNGEPLTINGKPLTTQAVYGKIRTICKQANGRVVVHLIALPELMRVGEKTTNHGFFATIPEYVRLITGTSHSKRLERRKKHD